MDLNFLLLLLLVTKPLITKQSPNKSKNLISPSSVSLHNSISLNVTWHCRSFKMEMSGAPNISLTGKVAMNLTRPRRANQSWLFKNSLRDQRNKPTIWTRAESRNTKKTIKTTINRALPGTRLRISAREGTSLSPWLIPELQVRHWDSCPQLNLKPSRWQWWVSLSQTHYPVTVPTWWPLWLSALLWLSITYFEATLP